MKAKMYPQTIPVMGIDVSKDKSDYCILDTDNRVVRRGVVKHTLDSMNKFLNMLSVTCSELDAKPVCIMEATAHYHRILYKQLVDNGYTVMVINPIQSGSIKNVDIRNIKNDKVDAYLYRLGKTGLDRPEDEILIPALIAIIHQLQESLNKADAEIAELIKNNDHLKEQTDLLKSIPSVGDHSAAALLAEIGDISLFSNAKQLTAYFGLDPAQRQSGKFNGTRTKLSKRGSSYLRRVISMVAVKNAFKQKNGTYVNPVLAEYYKNKCEYKEKKTALCAVMRKLVHIIFAVLRDRKPFELRTPEEHERLIFEKNRMLRLSA